jgi:acyl dehydratase
MKGRTVTEADVVAFAGLTGDFHPQHVDAEWAAQSPFGERIAHGLLVLSMAAGMVDFDPEEVIALRRVRDVVFKRPVKLGDTIRVSTEMGETAPTGIASVTLRITANDKLVARAILDVVVAEVPNEVSSDARRKLLALDDVTVCVPL